MNGDTKGRVLGVGGVFFRSPDPAALAAWYRRALGLSTEVWGTTHGTSFTPQAMPRNSFTVWSVFAADTEYFGGPRQAYMINLIVDDLDAALRNVARAGAEVAPEKEEQDFGRFGWFTDPDGNRVELWEPPADVPPSGE